MTNENRINRKKSAFCTLFLSAFIWIFLGAFSNVHAQESDTLDVPQGVGTLNQAIDSDTLENGERANLNRVYRLQRGGLYLLEGNVANRGYHLNIVAEEGDGPRPRLVPAVDGEGLSGRAFRIRGDLTVKGLYITNEDETGGLNTAMIRASADGIRIHVEDCFLEKDGQAAFRLDSGNMSIFISNTTIANIGTTDSPNNGRGIDARGNDIDTLIVENTTFFNLTSRPLRPAGAISNYIRFNHNTFINMGQGTAHFGEAHRAVFTNNIVHNGSFYGSMDDEDFDGVFVFQPHVTVDSLVNENGDPLEQHIDIRNNNFYVDPALIEVYEEPLRPSQIFNTAAQAFVDEMDAGNVVFEEAVAFVNAPASPVDVVTTWYEDPDAIQPSLDTEDQENFDFAYETSFAAYARSISGQPLGDLRWFGMTPTSTHEPAVVDAPRSFELHGNYPNPFNPTTNIRFDLPMDAQVEVDVFNIVGQKVLTVPSQQLPAGSHHTISIDASGLSSGVYIYRVTAQTHQSKLMNSGRMTLIK